MSKHTPGPWFAGCQNDALFVVAGKEPALNNDYPKHDASRVVLARVFELQGCADANARLIAAAPELLAALKGLRKALGNCGATPFEQAAFDAMDAAIAKAEGRS